MRSFDNGTELRRKMSNWEHLDRLFTKLSIPVNKKHWEPVMHMAPDSALELLKLVYQMLAKKELTVAPAQESSKPPPYARPTAVNLLRDTEFQRIEDKKTKEAQAYNILKKHNENIRQERTEPGRLALPAYTLRTQASGSKLEANEEQGNIEIRQVAVRAMDKNMRAAKALSLNKNDTKQDSKIDVNHSIVKPALEIMSEAFLEIMHQMAYKTIRAMEFSNVEHGEEMTKRFYDIMGNINPDFVNACFDNLVRRSGTLSDSLVKSAQEFESYSELIVATIQKIKVDAEHFAGFLRSLKAVGESMTSLDLNVSRQLFSHFMLAPVVQIVKRSPEKLTVLVSLIHSSSHSSAYSRLQLVREVFEASEDYCFIIRVIAELVTFDVVFSKDLHEYYKTHALQGVESPSPRIRASAVSILASLARLSPEFVAQDVPKLQRLINETWWETRAQLVRLAGIMLPFKPDPLLHKIIELNFKPSSSKNIVRIGLIYLAPCLNTCPELCDIYMECLISIEPEIREVVLSTDTVSVGNVVRGYFTQKYSLSGAPTLWNAFGVASSLSKFISVRDLRNLDYCHVEILWACLFRPPANLEWVQVYDQLKNYLFVGLEDPEICKGVIGVLKHFMTAPLLTTEILKKSFNTMINELSLLLSKTSDKGILAQTYEFVKSLYWGSGNVELQDFIYGILKSFAEKHPVLFDRSELVEIMNEIIRNRRGDIFEERNELREANE